MFHKNKESYFALYDILGFYPNDLSLYKEALLHKSSSKDENGRYLNNERLEFLGDAILDAVVADIVFKKYPTKNEGFLTNTRSKIVKRGTLDKIAVELGLNNLIVSSARPNASHNHILGNALEAFIGAIYLDQGYRKTKEFLKERVIEPYIDIETLARKEVNFKSKLLEWCQKNKVNLEFVVIEKFTDERNNPVFQSQALLNGLLAGVGTGFSKKESQQFAAKMAVGKIKLEKEFMQEILDLNPKENCPEVLVENEESVLQN